MNHSKLSYTSSLIVLEYLNGVERRQLNMSCKELNSLISRTNHSFQSVTVGTNLFYADSLKFHFTLHALDKDGNEVAIQGREEGEGLPFDIDETGSEAEPKIQEEGDIIVLDESLIHTRNVIMSIEEKRKLRLFVCVTLENVKTGQTTSTISEYGSTIREQMRNIMKLLLGQRNVSIGSLSIDFRIGSFHIPIGSKLHLKQLRCNKNINGILKSLAGNLNDTESIDKIYFEDDADDVADILTDPKKRIISRQLVIGNEKFVNFVPTYFNVIEHPNVILRNSHLSEVQLNNLLNHWLSNRKYDAQIFTIILKNVSDIMKLLKRRFNRSLKIMHGELVEVFELKVAPELRISAYLKMVKIEVNPKEFKMFRAVVLQKNQSSEEMIHVDVGIKEKVHVWFEKGADEFVQRTFGTVMISFPTSSINLLTSIQHGIEPLAFRLSNSQFIKSVLPNKQLIDESLNKKDEENYTFYFNKLQLATWLQTQKIAKPDAAFVNAEVARYEMDPTAPCNTVPPLFMTAYWKFEPGHTDLRVDYRLNSESPVIAPLLNVNFTTNLTGSIESVMCEPEGKWTPHNPSLGWSLLEISRNGDVHGSLKARIYMKNSGDENSLEMLDRKPAQVFVQFQCHEANLSGVDISLVQSDIYHLSMIRKKFTAGEYGCNSQTMN